MKELPVCYGKHNTTWLSICMGCSLRDACIEHEENGCNLKHNPYETLIEIQDELDSSEEDKLRKENIALRGAVYDKGYGIMEESNGRFSLHDVSVEGKELDRRTLEIVNENIDLTFKLKKLQTAFADYRDSEGCDCCRDTEAHLINEKRIAELLDVPAIVETWNNKEYIMIDWKPYRTEGVAK